MQGSPEIVILLRIDDSEGVIRADVPLQVFDDIVELYSCHDTFLRFVGIW